MTGRPQYTGGSTHYLFPGDWAAVYDLNQLYIAGTKGAGTSIAIVGRSNINLADVAQFRAASGLAAKNPSVILVTTNPGLVAGDQDESTLDVEWSGAVAPSAAVKFVVGTSTTDGVDVSAQYIVNHATAQVMSTSYGSCEADMGSTECPSITASGNRQRVRASAHLYRREVRAPQDVMAVPPAQHRARG